MTNWHFWYSFFIFLYSSLPSHVWDPFFTPTCHSRENCTVYSWPRILWFFIWFCWHQWVSSTLHHQNTPSYNFNGYITYQIRMLNTHWTRIQKSCIFLCYHRYPNLLPVFFNVRFGWDIECHFCLVNFIYSDGIYHHTLQNSMGNCSGIFSLSFPCIILLFTLGVDDGNSCLVDQLRPHVDRPHVRWFVILLHNLVQNHVVDRHHILLHPHTAQVQFYFGISGQFRHILDPLYFGSHFLLDFRTIQTTGTSFNSGTSCSAS